LDNDNRQQLFEDIIQMICWYECNWAIEKNNLLSVAFRLWVGCLSAAKTIAHGTRDGENTAAICNSKFKLIDERCKIDSVYRAGVETAPIWKRQIGDTFSFGGVPEASSVRRYSKARIYFRIW
jgi:hypothetical protein